MKDKSDEHNTTYAGRITQFVMQGFAVRCGILAIMYFYFSDVNRAIELLEKLQQSKQIN